MKVEVRGEKDGTFVEIKADQSTMPGNKTGSVLVTLLRDSVGRKQICKRLNESNSICF